MGSQFGVRRPVRYLAHKLDLSDKQTSELAKIIGDLKTERAQAAVEERRTIAAFADAAAGAEFDEAKAGEGARGRKDSQSKVADAVVATLKDIHALLDDDQRERLAYLIRTGSLSL